MKNIYGFVFATIAVSFLNSCKISPCDKKLCNGGTYEESGSTCLCVCPPGMEGDNCEIRIADAFIGSNLQTSEHWKYAGTTYTYFSSLSVDYYNNKLRITPFFQPNYYGASAEITSRNTIGFYDYYLSYLENGYYVDFRYSGLGVLANDSLVIRGALRETYPPYDFIDSVTFVYRY